MADNGDAGDEDQDRQYSTLDDHQREGSTLSPPLNQLNLDLRSWRNARLPDSLWALLLATHVERNSLLAGFRRVAEVFEEVPEGVQPDCTHSGLALLPDEILDEFFDVLTRDPRILQVLRPLLLFDELPLRERWESAIGEEPELDDWSVVERTVEQSLDHASRPSTDCRWLRVTCFVLGGRLQFVQGTETTAKCILGYPEYGPEGLAESVIRAAEGAVGGFIQASDDERTWPREFWNECMEKTPCGDCISFSRSPPAYATTTLATVKEVRSSLRRHAFNTIDTTDVDPAHEATFGLADYSLGILEELLRVGNATGILGRLGLRTLAECLITLKYMHTHDDPDIWQSYRVYGSGQAKLAFLKQDRLSQDSPESVDTQVLRLLANEDRWMEFTDVDLGHWQGTNLRSMAKDERVDLKKVYDQFYDWTSAFAHANWAAVRNASFGVCTNSLHRLHRVLLGETANLNDCIPDACRLVDQVLEILSQRYPEFAERVEVKETT